MGHSFFDDNNDVFEAMKEEETARTSGYNGVSIQPHETSETWYMVGNDQAVLPEMAHSLQEDFVLHDPAVMFPTTMSSTIPDATISQQQLVEAARAEYRQNQLGSRNLTAKILENPSVSWSDRLESTEVGLIHSLQCRCHRSSYMLTESRKKCDQAKPAPESPSNNFREVRSQRTHNHPSEINMDQMAPKMTRLLPLRLSNRKSPPDGRRPRHTPACPNQVTMS